MISQHLPPNTMKMTAFNALCFGLLILLGYYFIYPVAGAAMLGPVPKEAALAVVIVVLLVRFSINQTTASILTRRVLVLGVGKDAAMVNEALEHSHVHGLSVVGFYAGDTGQLRDSALPANKILPASKSICEIARQHDVSEIVLAMRDRRGGSLPLTDLIDCKLHGVKVTDLSSFFEQYQDKVRIDLLTEGWFIFGNGFRQHVLRMFVKRAFDIVSSGILLILSLPVMLLAAIAIKLDSPGPILYRQERVGLGGKTFELLKFRSMRIDAEIDGKPQWAQAGDNRVTRVGRFMRLTRIDELPQLITVLTGQMSLVGPRPERPYFVDQLVKQIPFYGARHSVKPGVTGWAQVRHHYGASVGDSSDKLQYDLYYVKNHTLLLDLLVLLYSVRVVLLAEGSR